MMAKYYGATSSPRSLPTWLRDQINEGNFPGLTWDDEEGVDYFRLPWVSENEPGSEMCYRLFHDWSERDGRSSVDNCTAKQRFRTALGKSNHLRKIRKVEKQTGSYILYKFLNADEMAEAKKMRRGKGTSDPKTPEGYRSSPNRDDGQLKTIDKPQDLFDDNTSPSPEFFSMMSDNQENFNNFGNDASNMVSSIYEPLISKVGNEDQTMMSIENQGSDFNSMTMQYLFNNHGITEEDFKSCDVTVYYDGVPMQSRRVLNMDKGLHIVHAKKEEDVKKLHGLFHEKYGNPHVGENIILQDAESKNLQLILNCTDVGIYVWYESDARCLMMERLCQSQVYYIDVHEENYTESQPVKIERKQMKMLFSYDKYFESHTQFLHNMLGNENSIGKKMPPDFFITIGACPTPMNRGEYKKGIKISFDLVAAKKFLQKPADPSFPCISVAPISIEHKFRQMKLNN